MKKSQHFKIPQLTKKRLKKLLQMIHYRQKNMRISRRLKYREKDKKISRRLNYR
jgi:hypothetical protein